MKLKLLCSANKKFMTPSDRFGYAYISYQFISGLKRLSILSVKFEEVEGNLELEWNDEVYHWNVILFMD